MSYIIIQHGFSSLHNGGGPGGPVRRGYIVAAVIVVVSGLGMAGFFAAKDYQAYTVHSAQLHKEWDAGQGRPAADKIEAGKTVTIEATASPINGGWDKCTYKSCHHADIPHYPTVMPVGGLSLRDGCYTDDSDVGVDAIMVGASRPDVYSITLQPGGKSIKICPIGPRQNEDKLIIWSDSPSAAR
jgi:hypothetical protein